MVLLTARKSTTHSMVRNIIWGSAKPPRSGPEVYYLGPEGYYLLVLFWAAFGLGLVVITTD